MNPRERFNRIMNRQAVDRPPIWSVEMVTEGAVRRWVRDGTFPIGMSVSDVFPLDPVEIHHLDTGPLPSFVPCTLEENERWRLYKDDYGFTVKALKEQDVTPRVYTYVAGIVRERRDWEELKKRYDPSDPRRKPRNWSPELIERWDRATHPVGMSITWGPGRGPKNGYTMGLEPFLEKVIEDPGLVKDMFDFWADFVIETACDFVTRCRIDFVYLVEDGMGYRNTTLVSPQAYRNLWIPAIRRVTDFLRGHGIRVIAHYSSGNQVALIPALLEAGVNAYLPLEVAAGMDAPSLRRRFGKEILLIGNISRQALMDGPEAVEREFRAKVPSMMADGGYIPAVDDAITPDIAFESYARYLDLVRECRL